MASNPTLQTIYSDGMFHGLPTFPKSISGLTAIVTGANGISGTHMLRVLCKDPNRWTKIYALSRRPPPDEFPSHVVHVSLDLLQDAASIAQQLKDKGINADYVFFFAYIQPTPKKGKSIWSAAEDLVKVNKQLLENFLGGIQQADIIPKRILLQLGAKYYGVHLGPATVPQEESDPRVLLEPNFYYPQEDLLKAFCARHDGCGWNTTRPSWIPGAVRDAAMNIVHPLAVYATVQKHLGQPLIFPADLNCWEVLVTFSTAMLNCHLAEWAVLTKGTANESFNAVDGCSFAWGKFWPKLAAHFDMPWTGPDTEPDAHYREMTTPYSPPPRGWGPPGTTRYKFTFTEWARRDEVTAAWREVAEKNNIANKELVDPDRIFGFLDACILGTCPVVLSEVKLRKHGFFGFVDSAESILHVIGELAEIGMIPKV